MTKSRSILPAKIACVSRKLLAASRAMAHLIASFAIEAKRRADETGMISDEPIAAVRLQDGLFRFNRRALSMVSTRDNRELVQMLSPLVI